MRKSILFVCLLMIKISAFSQKEILNVDFETVPAGFKTFNLDGLPDDCGTPGEFSKGWLLSTPMGFTGGSGKYAKDCSDHGSNTSSKADDWLVSRGIKVGSSSLIVSWVNFSEWNQNILLYASKKFNGTSSDLSKFTLIATVSNSAWTFNPHSASLSSLGLVPGDSLYIAFRNNVAHKGQFYMDNLVISEVQNRDAGIGTYDSKLYSNVNTLPLKGKIYNYGALPVTSYTLNWTINGGTVNSQTFSGLNVANGNYHFFQTTGNVAYSDGDNTLKMYVSNINGAGPDDEKKNDTLVEHVYIIKSPTVLKNVLIGDYTGTWCGNCVDAFPIIDSLTKNPRFMAVAMHVQSDPMTTAQTTAFTKRFNISAFPTLTFDMRAFDPDDNTPGVLGGPWPCVEWRNRAAEALAEITPVDVKVNYKITSPSTRTITINVIAEFKDEGAYGDLRMNCYIAESPVSSSSSNYDQTNYRNTIAGHPFYGLGDHINGFKHKHVFRNALGGIDGTPGVIPAVVKKGQTFQKQYTYQVPTGYDMNKLQVVGFVSRYNANNLYNPVYNSDESTVPTGLNGMETNADDVVVYPNPAHGQLMVDIKGVGQISICNALGQECSSQNFNSESGGTIALTTSGLPTGMYILKINCDNRIITKKITIENQ